MAKPLKIKKLSRDDRPDTAARRILRTRIKEFYSYWPDPKRTPSVEQLHNLRISGKRLRYGAESLRELYPDKLSLMIDLLKRSQDMLGEIQDCVTQRGLIKAYLTRMRRRVPQSEQISALEKIIAENEQRQTALFTQFHDNWRGMSMDEFRESLMAMASRPKKSKPKQPTSPEHREPVLHVVSVEESFPIDQTGDEARAETVVNVDDGDV